MNYVLLEMNETYDSKTMKDKQENFRGSALLTMSGFSVTEWSANTAGEVTLLLCSHGLARWRLNVVVWRT